MKLYDYFRSSAAYRVRIALNLQGMAPERSFVHLRKGNQRAEEYLALNPLGTIPFMVDGETKMTESSGICHYLGIKHGSTPLMVVSAFT